MAVTVAGKLVTGDGVAIPDVTISFKAIASSNLGGSEVINGTTFTTVTDSVGDYSVSVNNGSYSITVTIGTVSTTLGTAIIDGSTPSPIDVLELVAYAGVSQTTAQDILDQAVAAKNAAEAAQTAAETAQGLAEAAQAGAQAAASIMSKAEFEALAQARRNELAGSGYVEYGKQYNGGGTYDYVNEGITAFIGVGYENMLLMGRDGNSFTGVSKTNMPLININGSVNQILGVNDSALTQNKILLPEAPTVTHADSTNSGLVKNGDFSLGDNGDWVVSGSGTISISGGKLTINTNGGIWSGGGVNLGALTAGETYLIEIDVDSTTGIMAVILDDSISGSSLISWKTVSGSNKHRIELTPTATSSYLRLTNINVATSDTYVINSISAIPKSALSRQDVVFIRSKAVDTSVKNIWYPFGNSQYLGSDTDGLTGIAAGSFTGFETYSLFGDWQASSALIGKGYVPTSLTSAQQAAFAGNPLNNIYQDGDTIYQEEYKIEVTKGTTDYGSLEAFATEQGFTQDATDKGLWWDGTDKIIPIALVTRKHNQGAYHPIFNVGGTRKVLNTANTAQVEWHESNAKQITSTIDCFDFSATWAGGVADGILAPESNLTGSIDGLVANVGNPDDKFYDAIYASDIIDLRNSAHKNPTRENMLSVVQNAINGTKRSDYDGDGEWETTVFGSMTCDSKVFTSNKTAIYTFSGFTTLSPERFNPAYGGRIAFLQGDSGRFYKIDNAYNGGAAWLDESHGDVTADFTVSLTYSVVIAEKSTRKSSGEKLHCDLIGDPAFYPKTVIDYTTTGATQTVSVVKGDKVSYAVASGSTGVGTVGNYYVAKVDQASIDLDTQDFSNTTNWMDTGSTNTVDWQGDLANGYTGAFTPLVVGENGEDYIPDGTTKTIKMSRKAKEKLLVIDSLDGGSTWNVRLSTIYDEITTSSNSVNIGLTSERLVMIFYTTTDNYTYPVVNTAVLPDGVGDVVAINKNTIADGNSLLPSLINKVGISAGDGDMAHGEGYVFDSNGEILTTPSHNALTLSNDNPAVKFLPVAVSENGRLCIDLHFKEMVYDVTWGDDSLINIADNVTTTTDDNGNTVLIGTKRIKTEFFA